MKSHLRLVVSNGCADDRTVERGPEQGSSDGGSFFKWVAVTLQVLGWLLLAVPRGLLLLGRVVMAVGRGFFKTIVGLVIGAFGLALTAALCVAVFQLIKPALGL